MNRLLSLPVLVIGLLLTGIATAEPLKINSDDSIVSILSTQKGNRVTIKLNAGEGLTGTVGEVNKQIVQLHELTGKEYYDAVVVLKGIAAVIIRTKE